MEEDEEDDGPAEPPVQEVDGGPPPAEEPARRPVFGAQDENGRDAGDGEEAEPVRVGAQLRLGQEGREEEGRDEEGDGEAAEAEWSVGARRVAGRRVARRESGEEGGEREGEEGRRADDGGEGEVRPAGEAALARRRFGLHLLAVLEGHVASPRVALVDAEQAGRGPEGPPPVAGREDADEGGCGEDEDEGEGRGPGDGEVALVLRVGHVRVVHCERQGGGA